MKRSVLTILAVVALTVPLEAVQGVNPGGVCVNAIELTETSSVDASGSSNGNDRAACELASSLARTVEKKLP